ncbi:MAG TPA: phasin family protein [Beijerinckiaceae bacterium]|jgi:phasin family protein
MFKNIEDMQKFGKENFDAAAAATATLTKSVQQIAAEATEYSKKSVENATQAFEKLIGAKSLDGAIQVQSDYAKSAYEAFVAQSTKMGELYTGLAKEMFKPVETAVAKVQASAK